MRCSLTGKNPCRKVWIVSLTDRVSAAAQRLTATDRQLLEVLLSHPQEAAYLAAAEVADRAGVHQASATKLAQKLGYTGYPDLRRDLREDVLPGGSPADRVQRRLEHMGAGSVLGALVAAETSALADLPRQVPEAELADAASRLLRARRRCVFAHGNASVLSDLLARRLARFGLPTQVLPASGRDLAEQLVALGPDDVVVVFAFLRLPPHLRTLLDHARSTGAGVVLVTDTLGGELGGDVDVLLSGARGSGREFQSLTVPMAITNALVLEIARLAPDQTRHALSDLEKLLAAFEH